MDIFLAILLNNEMKNEKFYMKYEHFYFNKQVIKFIPQIFLNFLRNL